MEGCWVSLFSPQTLFFLSLRKLCSSFLIGTYSYIAVIFLLEKSQWLQQNGKKRKSQNPVHMFSFYGIISDNTKRTVLTSNAISMHNIWWNASVFVLLEKKNWLLLKVLLCSSAVSRAVNFVRERPTVMTEPFGYTVYVSLIWLIYILLKMFIYPQ